MPPSEIYLVRHAIAAERGDDWPDDTKRPLTEEGISRFKEAVGGLKALDATIEEIFTSPLVRARQTADLLAAGVRGRPTVKLLDALLIGARRALPFKKGGICRIDVASLSTKTAGTLLWFVTPKILRKLAS